VPIWHFLRLINDLILPAVSAGLPASQSAMPNMPQFASSHCGLRNHAMARTHSDFLSRYFNASGNWHAS
jgi:hypothetical protein